MFILLNMLLLMMSVHSMSVVFMLCLITLIYSVYMFKMLGTFWFSYVMLMVMLSGVLVVFSYVVSLSSNEKMSFNLFTLFMLLMVIFYELILENFDDMNFLSMKMWNQSLVWMNLFLILLLFMLMLLVIWVSSANEGSIQGFEKFYSWM